MICSMLAQLGNSQQELCESVKVASCSKDFLTVPYRKFIEEFRKSSRSDSVIVVSWTVQVYFNSFWFIIDFINTGNIVIIYFG